MLIYDGLHYDALAVWSLTVSLHMLLDQSFSVQEEQEGEIQFCEDV